MISLRKPVNLRKSDRRFGTRISYLHPARSRVNYTKGA